jgi:hypothetical protein
MIRPQTVYPTHKSLNSLADEDVFISEADGGHTRLDGLFAKRDIDSKDGDQVHVVADTR